MRWDPHTRARREVDRDLFFLLSLRLRLRWRRRGFRLSRRLDRRFDRFWGLGGLLRSDGQRSRTSHTFRSEGAGREGGIRGGVFTAAVPASAITNQHAKAGFCRAMPYAWSGRGVFLVEIIRVCCGRCYYK